MKEKMEGGRACCRALELSKQVAGSFKGKKKLDYPEGFSSKKE